MTTEYFLKIFRYNFTVNTQLFNLIKEQNIMDKYVLSVFSHLLTAENIWAKRIKGIDVTGKVIWPELPIEEVPGLIRENEELYENLLKGLSGDDLIKSIVYKNSKGAEFTTPTRDILMHVIIHCGYHRGQIASAIRRIGREPINTDYITYVRQL